MNAEHIFYFILLVLVFNFVLGMVLDYLDYHYWSPEMPEELKPYYNAETYRKAYAYHKEKDRLGFLSGTINFTILVIFFSLGGFGKLNGWLEQYISHPVWLALAYFGLLGLISAIVNLPFGLYSTFVIEEKYGFNRTSLKTYILDRIKGLALTLVLGCTLGYFVLWLMLALKQDFWLYAWLVITAFSVFLNFFYTSLIVPLFNKLSPLGEGSLRDKITAYAQSVRFPLMNVFVVDGSRRSTKANAYFAGFGKKKKVVLYDTLIQKHSEEELVAVLAHEVGHFKRKHILQNLVLGILQSGFMLWLLSRFLFSHELSIALGANNMRLHLNLLAFGILFEPISLVIGIAMNVLSRRFEYEADEFAVKTADSAAFQQALVRLSTDNLANLRPHPAYVFVHYSHPTLLQRLKAIRKETH